MGKGTHRVLRTSDSQGVENRGSYWSLCLGCPSSMATVIESEAHTEKSCFTHLYKPFYPSFPAPAKHSSAASMSAMAKQAREAWLFTVVKILIPNPTV